MSKVFFADINGIQPSQLYISELKLAKVRESFNPLTLNSVTPIPIKKLNNKIIFTDGHTRAFALYLEGFSKIPVYWDGDELDWENYETCLNWCEQEGIMSISDFENRVINESDYKKLWYDRCSLMLK